jgi:hypothetical protein
VRGEATGTRYRLIQMRSYNVIELDGTGRERDVLCFVPAGGLVMGDQLLAQKVALETDERAALKVANRRSDEGVLMPCGCPECRRPRLRDNPNLWRPQPGPQAQLFQGEWRDIDGRPTAMVERERVPPPQREQRNERAPDPNSWLANWGAMGRDLLAAREQGSSSRRGRRRR